MTLAERVKRVEGVLPRLLKDFLQRSDYDMSAFVEHFMDDKGPPKGQRSTSSQIGLQSGRLSRSLIPGQRDHVSVFKITGVRATLQFGTSVPYAMIHEHGGTVNNPGGQDFMIIDGRFIPLQKGHPKSFGKTRPHTIAIPARPFLKPGFEKWRNERYPVMQDELVKAVIHEFNAK